MFQIHIGEKSFSKKLKLNICLDQQAEFMFKKDKKVLKRFPLDNRFNVSYIKLGRGVVIITTAQPHLSRSELRFCTGSNPARGVSKTPDGENL